MGKVIWIINQYASHLETRHMELSKSFALQGYKVAVITSSFHHGKRQYIFDEKYIIEEKSKDVLYVYLHSTPAYTGNGAKRILNMLDFCRMVGIFGNQLVREIGKPTAIIASSAPPFVWEVGYRLSKRYGAKFIAEFRDIWPLSLIEIQGVSETHPLVKIIAKVEKRAYKHADAIVSTMPFAYEHVKEVVPGAEKKTHWMANGVNYEEVKKAMKNDKPLPKTLESYLRDHWCCIYVGSIVRSECLDYLVRAFSKVSDPDIYFAIVGDGHEKERIQKIVKDEHIKNVQFFPAIDRMLIPKALFFGKVCIAAHENHSIYRYGLSMNKINDYLSSGKPTVFVCGAKNQVEEAGHFSIEMGDEKAFVNAIVHIKNMGENEIKELEQKAIFLIKSEYDYLQIGQRYLKMIEEL